MDQSLHTKMISLAPSMFMFRTILCLDIAVCTQSIEEQVYVWREIVLRIKRYLAVRDPAIVIKRDSIT